MDFPFAECEVSADFFPLSRARELLRWEDGLAFALLDLARLERKRRQLAGSRSAAFWLAPEEQQVLDKFALEKRRQEWFGGRMAAKYAAAALLGRSARPLPWAGLTVRPDQNGRPGLAGGTLLQGLPDISISHSGSLAGAMAVSPGWCGMDIQAVTERVVKVRDRFCTPAEQELITACFDAAIERQPIGLTTLWAAKEALRKVAATPNLPGFLDLVLTTINNDYPGAGSVSRRLVFEGKKSAAAGSRAAAQYSVAVCHAAGYVLALTARGAAPDAPPL